MVVVEVEESQYIGWWILCTGQKYLQLTDLHKRDLHGLKASQLEGLTRVAKGFYAERDQINKMLAGDTSLMPIEVLRHHFKEDIQKLSMDHMIPLESIQEILAKNCRCFESQMRQMLRKLKMQPARI